MSSASILGVDSTNLGPLKRRSVYEMAIPKRQATYLANHDARAALTCPE
jgi:hypothetical protein